jgi:hypothetical protein
MKAEAFHETPPDAALDGEIRALFVVDPSPQFHASVRARIASDSAATSPRRTVWLGAGLAALAAVIIAVAIVAPGRSLRTPQDVQQAALAARGSVGVAPAISPGTGRARSADALRSADLSARALAEVEAFAHRSSSDEIIGRRKPEVLLAPDETRALRALIAGVRDGRIDLAPVAHATTPDVMELEPIHDLVIAPIVITPVEGVQP